METLALTDLLLRLGVATALTAALGLDRELSRKAAGLRTHMLIGLAAASFTVLMAELIAATDWAGETIKADPGRAIEAVVAGVAFLGAGAIFRGGDGVSGLTTGASMWLAGAVGVAAGSGVYAVAIIATVIGLLALTLVGFIEARILRRLPHGKSPEGPGERERPE